MAFEELVSGAPKSLRPALWVIAFALVTGSLALAGMSAIEAKAAMAANQVAIPLTERVSKLEAGQEQIWKEVGSKLDAISTQLTQTRQDVAVLSQKVEDQKLTKK